MDCASLTSSSNSTASSTRQSLVDRANRIIEQFNLSVPRSCALNGLNYYFWSAVFNKVFGIRCNPSARNREEHIGHLKACLNMLEIVLEVSVSHIQANDLLQQDVSSIQNLLEIVELCAQSKLPSSMVKPNPVSTRFQLAGVDLNLPAFETIDRPQQLPLQNAANEVQQITSANKASAKGSELAEKLEKSLKNQILAMEIEKKIKMYLGDVSVAKQSSKLNPQLRANRQSIVRTRSIQPSGAFDSTCNGIKGNSTAAKNVLSNDLLRLFPEIANEKEVITKIQSQEKRLLMSERQIELWAAEKTNRTLNCLLERTIDHQQQRLALQEKEALKELENAGNVQRKAQLSQQTVQRRARYEERSQRATLQKEIDDFLRQSTAAYLNARSIMENILVEEFKKVDARQRQQISEIRKYLQNYYEIETDKLRALLDNFDEMLQ